jgi:tetratricopeptide (TPR) repeat protein
VSRPLAATAEVMVPGELDSSALKGSVAFTGRLACMSRAEAFEVVRQHAAIECLRKALRVAPDYSDAMFNLALLLQRKDQYPEAAEYWRRYLTSDCQSEWAVRARRSLKFCEMQRHLSASA